MHKKTCSASMLLTNRNKISRKMNMENDTLKGRGTVNFRVNT